jgi:hypothetical protein
MYFAVVHRDITNWDRFDNLDLDNAPTGLQSIGYFPDILHSRAICLWQSTSASALRTYLDGLCQGLCTNEYFEIEERIAVGLPRVPTPA